MIILDIDTGAKQDIEAFEGDNTKEIKTIALIKDNNRVDLTGKKIDLGYVDTNFQTLGDVIENLTISNAKQGEISLPINSNITKKDGIYNCAFRITTEEGYKKTTAPFLLNIKANLFNKIGKAILDNNSFSKIKEILDKADSCLKKLETFNTTDIENKIDKATELNKSLTSNVVSVDSKNNMLKDSLKQAEDFSKTLNGSTDFVQMRKDIDTLESNLKSKQTLAYQGSNITCNNSLAGRTTGLKLNGRTLQNIANYDCLFANTSKEEGNIFKLNYGGDENSSSIVPKNNFMYKPDTEYVIIVDILENTTNGKRLGISSAWTDIIVGEKLSFSNTLGISSLTIRTKPILGSTTLGMVYFCSWDRGTKDLSKYIKFKYMIIEKALLNNVDINTLGHFEGVQGSSDKSKNLFNLEESKKISGSNITINGDNIIFNQSTNRFTLKDSGFKANTQYTLSFLKVSGLCDFSVWYSDGSTSSNSGRTSYTTLPNKTVIAIKSSDGDKSQSIVSNVQIVEGNQDITYEPYYEGNKVKYKSCGKNLCNPKAFIQKSIRPYGNGIKIIDKDSVTVTYNLKGLHTFSCKIASEGVVSSGGALIGIKQQDDTFKYVLIDDTVTSCPNGIKEIVIYNYCSGTHLVTDMQIEKDTKTSYQPYQEDVKTIQLPSGYSFNGLKDVQDVIEETEKGVEYTQTIGKVVLDGTEDWNIGAASGGWAEFEDTLAFYIVNSINPKYDSIFICDKFAYISDVSSSNLIGISNQGWNAKGHFAIRIKKSKLPTSDIEGFKKWLQNNPIQVWYPLATPVKTILPGVIETDLNTFDIITHCMFLNTIPGTMDFNIPTNYGSRINQLEQENNRIWNVINNLIVPALIDTNKNMALKSIQNNL